MTLTVTLPVPVMPAPPLISRYLEYERQKRRLVELDLCPQEYERRIAILAAGLGV